jgi:ankyrin repeat protein
MDYLERGNSDKDTALHYAAKCTDNVEMARLLGGLVNILNVEGVSPLLAAVQHERSGMVEYLAGRSDMGVRTKDGDTVLHIM